jgi:aspartate-semialdehyde dehydrogenase
MFKKYKVAIVGATGLVGRTVLKVLEEKNLSNLSYTLFSSSKSAGSKIDFFKTNYIVLPLENNSFEKKFDFAIFCAGRSSF